MNIDELRRFAPGARPAILNGIVEHWHHAESSDINSPLRICHFMAQLAHESDGLNTTVEYADGSAYEGRKDLGNTQAGDGKRFRGRGLIQLTGRANYRKFGAEKDPESVAGFPDAFRAACWFWNLNGLNRLADRQDIRAVTRRINGGYNGLPDRRNRFRKAAAIWGAGEVNPQGKPFIGSRTVKAAMGSGAAGLAAIADGVYQASTAVERGQTISEAFGISLVTLALGAAVAGLLAYILYDRWFVYRNEGL